MTRSRRQSPIIATCALYILATIGFCEHAVAQSGLRDSLDSLDRNGNGEIDPKEITSLARPYLERVAKTRNMTLDRSYSIERWQEAARIYYALINGVSDKRIEPNLESSVKGFGPDRGVAIVPEFGLPQVKYPYTQEDLDEADESLERYDRNRDGYIDRAEALRGKWTHRDPFEEDYNFDGRLSRLELTQRYARRRLLDGAAGELVQKARRVGNGLRPADDDNKSDSDRRWSRYGGSRFDLTASVLSRFDLNRNGRLEPNESARLGIPAGRIDVDRNGELSRDELHSFLSELQEQAGDPGQGIPAWFFERDQNRDDQVTMAEYADEWSENALVEFASLDSNDDGILTAAEVSRSAAAMGGSFVNNDAEVLPPRKTVISELVIDEHFEIADLDVQLSITHSHVSYLDAYLIAPDGRRVELFTSVGGTDDNFELTVFDDQASIPITKARAPFEGKYLPEAVMKQQPGLAQFNGMDASGVWQLVIAGARNERFGMLHRWSLMITPQDSLSPGGMTLTNESLTTDESSDPQGASQMTDPRSESDSIIRKQAETIAKYREMLLRRSSGESD